jgi:hypothetical protein
MFIQSQRKGRRVYKWLTQSNKCLKTVDGWRVRKTVAGRSVSLINGFAPELVDCTEKNKKEKKLLDKKQTKKTFGKERGAAEEGYPKAGSQSKRASTPHTHATFALTRDCGPETAVMGSSRAQAPILSFFWPRLYLNIHTSGRFSFRCVFNGWILRLRLQRPCINVSAFDILLLFEV